MPYNAPEQRDSLELRLSQGPAMTRKRKVRKRMSERPSLTREELIEESKKVEAAIRSAVREALITHKRLGQAIIVCDENGKVVRIPAEDIEIYDLPQDPLPPKE
jgi:hypothetical protein